MSSSRFLTAYIDLPFIEKLLDNRPDDAMTDPYADSPEMWRNVFLFLQRHAHIITDVDQETLENRESIQGFLFGERTLDVDIRPGAIQRFVESQQADVEDPYTLFLLENPDIPIDELRKQTGLLFLRYSDLERDWLRLFKPHNIDVSTEADEEFKWSHLRQHGCPLNALVVADRYAYSQFTNGSFEENLGALFLSFLSESIVETVHITLVTDFWKAFEKSAITPEPNEVHDRIEDHLNLHRPDLNVEVTVLSYKRGAGHKDRFVFTNYAWFDSNDSFEFFRNGKISKETRIHHVPLYGENGLTARRYLERFARINSDPPEHLFPSRPPMLLASGSAGNRLLGNAHLSS